MRERLEQVGMDRPPAVALLPVGLLRRSVTPTSTGCSRVTVWRHHMAMRHAPATHVARRTDGQTADGQTTRDQIVVTRRACRR